MSKVGVNRLVAWILLVIGLLASGASSIFDLYKKIWWFDEALHGYLTFAFTLMLALYAYGALVTGRRRHTVLLILTIAGLGLGLGAAWEWIEWVYDSFTGSNSIKGKLDTMIDLSMDAVGGLLAGIVSITLLNRRYKKGNTNDQQQS